MPICLPTRTARSSGPSTAFSGLVAIQSGHTLVTNGIYGVIRHPSYLSLRLNSRLGPGLSFGSRCAAHGPAYRAALRAHRCRGEASAHAVWRRVQCLSRPCTAADSRALLAAPE